MANEEVREKDTGEEKAPKKKGFKKLLIMAAAALILIAGAGAFAAWKFNLGPFAELNKVQKKIVGLRGDQEERPNPRATLGPIKPLDTFIVNLIGEKGERYLKITMNVEMDGSKALEEVTKREPQIRDAIIILLSSKTFEDVMQVEGKEKLKKEIITRVNSFVGTGKAKQVYFTEFVVQ